MTQAIIQVDSLDLEMCQRHHQTRIYFFLLVFLLLNEKLHQYLHHNFFRLHIQSIEHDALSLQNERSDNDHQKCSMTHLTGDK